MHALAYTFQERISRFLDAFNGQLNRLKRMRAKKENSLNCINCNVFLDLIERGRARIMDKGQHSIAHEALNYWLSRPSRQPEPDLLRHFYLESGNSFLRDEYEKNRKAVIVHSPQESAALVN